MGAYINKTTVTSAVAVLAGLFVYKQYVERHVTKVIGGGAA
jgi:hypothetical protein